MTPKCNLKIHKKQILIETYESGSQNSRKKSLSTTNNWLLWIDQPFHIWLFYKINIKNYTIVLFRILILTIDINIGYVLLGGYINQNSSTNFLVEWMIFFQYRGSTHIKNVSIAGLISWNLAESEKSVEFVSEINRL